MVSGPITSWQIDEEAVETVTDFILLEVLGGSGVHKSQARLQNMSHAYIDKAGE